MIMAIDLQAQVERIPKAIARRPRCSRLKKEAENKKQSEASADSRTALKQL
jgi:hypothetical protein